MPNAIWIWRAAASRARRGLGLAPEIQSAADGGALQIIISLQPFLIDSPDSNKCMLEFLRSNWSDILWHVAQHLWLVFISIAVAMGMTDRQVLFQVELPLAMSVILTGVRVAIVITIGVAIIAAEVGAGGLGEYIFRGLRMNDNRLLLAGAVPSALMALVADFGFGLIERRFDPGTPRTSRRPLRVLAWATLMIGVVMMGYAAWRGIHNRSSSAPSHGHVTVGSKDFTESVLLAEIVAQMLEAKNIEVDRRFDLGGNLGHS